MDSQFRFNWHGLDFAVRVRHTQNAREVIEVHQVLVLEARWLDDGTWVEEEDLRLVLRFVAERWQDVVKKALISNLYGGSEWKD